MSTTTFDQEQGMSTTTLDQEQGTSRTILDQVQERLSHFEPKQMGETELSRLCDRAQISAALGWNPTDDWAVFLVVMGVTPRPDGVMRRGA